MSEGKASDLQRRALRGTPPSLEPVRIGWTGLAVKRKPNDQRYNRLQHPKKTRHRK